LLFSHAKRAVAQALARRSLIERREPAERQAILTLVSRFYALSLTLEERLISINRQAGEDEAYRLKTEEYQALQDASSQTSELSSIVLAAVGANNPFEVHQLEENCATLLKLAERLGEDAVARLDWGLGAWQFQDLERKIVSHIRFADQRWLKEEEEQAEETRAELGETRKWWHRLVEAIPHQIRTYPYFYAVFFGTYIGIFMSFFVYIGSGRLRDHTFLNLPPQYDLKNVKLQVRLAIRCLCGWGRGKGH
jgi:hypothetical protein